jgi:hypothetical protein
MRAVLVATMIGWRYGVAIALLTACVGDDPADLALRYETAKYCPRERVHVGPVPELGLELVHAIGRAGELWHEPDLPADVRTDPARLAVWQAQRDAAFHAWQVRQRAADPVTGLAAESERHVPIYAATGCGGTELFQCRAYRHSFGCTPVTALGPIDRLVCRDGRSPHAIGDAVGCVAGPAIADPYECAKTCATDESCNLACSDDRCRLTCAVAATSCRSECFETARTSCVAAGLDRFELCESVASQARQFDDARKSITATAANVQAQFDARDALTAAIAAGERCEHTCTRTDVGCYAKCATTTREQCERDIRIANWCDGLRAKERGLLESLR